MATTTLMATMEKIFMVCGCSSPKGHQCSLYSSENWWCWWWCWRRCWQGWRRSSWWRAAASQQRVISILSPAPPRLYPQSGIRELMAALPHPHPPSPLKHSLVGKSYFRLRSRKSDGWEENADLNAEPHLTAWTETPCGTIPQLPQLLFECLCFPSNDDQWWPHRILQTFALSATHTHTHTHCHCLKYRERRKCDTARLPSTTIVSFFVFRFLVIATTILPWSTRHSTQRHVKKKFLLLSADLHFAALRDEWRS